VSAAYKRIYLVGLPGAGKSTLGQALADRLGWDFLDTDRLVEAKAGNSISVLFLKQGEQAFRVLESEVLSECSVKTGVVVATGGGAPAHPGNMELMLSSGLTVWLNPNLDEIARRLRSNSGQRPLLQESESNGIEVRLSELLEQRSRFYRKAALKMSGKFAEYDLYLAVNQLVT